MAYIDRQGRPLFSLIVSCCFGTIALCLAASGSQATHLLVACRHCWSERDLHVVRYHDLAHQVQKGNEGPGQGPERGWVPGQHRCVGVVLWGGLQHFGVRCTVLGCPESPRERRCNVCQLVLPELPGIPIVVGLLLHRPVLLQAVGQATADPTGGDRLGHTQTYL